MSVSGVRRLVPLVLFAAACDGAAAEPTAAPTPIGKGDCATCDGLPSCAEEAARPGVEAPLFRSSTDPHLYFAAPTRWVVEDVSATYWLAGSFQYFDAADVAGFERYTLSSHLSLQVADSDEELVQALRTTDPDARVAALPITTSSLETLEEMLPTGMAIGRRATWDATSLTADLDLELTREGVEAATRFFSLRTGIAVVGAGLTFTCADETGTVERTIHPNAGGPSVGVAYDGVPVDDSTGAVAMAADQIMLNAATILPFRYDRRLPEAELATLLRPLLGYDADTTVALVQSIGRDVAALVDAWADAEATSGTASATVERDLESLRFQIGILADFAPHVRVHPLE